MAGSVQDPSERSARTVSVNIYSKSLWTYIYNKSLWSNIYNKSFKTNLCHDTIQFSVFCKKYTGVIQYTVSQELYSIQSLTGVIQYTVSHRELYSIQSLTGSYTVYRSLTGVTQHTVSHDIKWATTHRHRPQTETGRGKGTCEWTMKTEKRATESLTETGKNL